MNKKILLALFLAIPCFLYAQKKEYPYELEEMGWDSVYNRSTPKVLSFLEFGTAANSYSGDLGGVRKWSNSFFIGLKLNKKKGVNFHFAATIGSLIGENRKYNFVPEKGIATPNTYFKTNFFQLQFDIQINFIKREHLIVYFSQGLGLMRFTPRDQNGNSLQDDPSTRAKDEEYPNVVPFLPTGIGGMYILKNGYAAGMQIGFMNPMTDYIDNIGEWGAKTGNDNALTCRFSIFVPLKKRPISQIPEKSGEIFTR